MARAQSDLILWAGGAAAAFAGYEFLYKPWKAKQTPGGLNYLPTPAIWPPYTPTAPGAVAPPVGSPPAPGPGGITGSIVDPRITPGGDVGQAMWRKHWTETQARTRLDQLKTAYAGGKSNVVELRKQTADPNLLLKLQADAAQLDFQAATADQAAAAAQAAGDLTNLAKWQGAAAVARQDAKTIRAQIAGMPAAVNPAVVAKIAEWETAMAGHANDYQILTGFVIPGYRPAGQ